MVWTVGGFLVIVIYLCLAVCPFRRQPAASQDTQKLAEQIKNSYVQTEKAHTDREQAGSERAMVLPDSRDALTERLRLIAGAQERIILSTFDMRSDESGKLLLGALLEAAQRGVEIRVVLDGYSYFTQAWGNPYFLVLAGQEKAELRIYNIPNILKPWKLMARMHDKYLIADEEVYILGGRNSNDLFLGEPDENQNYDWDVLVCQAGDTPEESSLNRLEEYFLSVWESGECKPIGKSPFWRRNPSVERAEEELNEVWETCRKEHPEWLEAVDYEKMTRRTRSIRLLANPIHTGAKEPVVYHVMTELMAQPGQKVTFHTPYILCSDGMQGRLEWLCGQNRDVTMMTNSIANNANPFGAMDYMEHKGRLLETGLKVLEYDSGVSYHGKCFTIGERLSGIGSFNWDMRSAYIDTELMLIIDSEELTGDLRAAMGAYEETAFRVLDTERYEAEDGAVMQELSAGKAKQLKLLQRLLGWLRFLM